MAEGKKIATCDSFGSALRNLGMIHDDLFAFDTGSSDTAVTASFKRAFPDQHFSYGTSHGGLVAVAAGTAAMGLVPFVCTADAFASGQAFEQVHGLAGDSRQNVKICAFHGDSIHQCYKDFAVMRSIPGMVVLCPSDDVEARAAVRAAYEYQGPVYLRFSWLQVPVFHKEGTSFHIGKGEVLREGRDVAILATGVMVWEAVQAGETLAAHGISARIISLATIKPLDQALVLKAAQECGSVITCEEHSVTGGLGEAVCGLLSGRHPTPVYRLGIQDSRSAGAEEPLKKLTAENIVSAAKKALTRK